jgi:hypothetical protein
MVPALTANAAVAVTAYAGRWWLAQRGQQRRNCPLSSPHHVVCLYPCTVHVTCTELHLHNMCGLSAAVHMRQSSRVY